MKKNYVALFVIGLLLLIAVITNPNEDRHKEVVKAKFNSYVQMSMPKELSEADDEGGQASQGLAMMLGGAMIDGIIANIVTTDNYVIFSTTNVSWEGKSKVIGIGVFGNIFLTGKLDEVLEERLLSK